jgi:transposase
MREHIALRDMTPQERATLEQLARSRTAQARLVQRAQILLGLRDGDSLSAVARRLGVTRPTVYAWIARFNEAGMDGLQDRPRPGRPPTYTAEQRAEVIAAALTKPDELGLPFSSWTLDRLQAYFQEHKGIAIKRSRIDEILLDEGLRWRKQETWFGERVDPDFAQKRGSSNSFTRPRRKAASSSASMKGDPSRPRASPAKRRSAPQRQPGRTARCRPGGPNRRSTTAGGARGTSSGRSGRRQGKR